MSTLLLVDGSSYLYRAYFAMPDLRNGAGQPTGAIYGIINMLQRLREQYPAQYLACVFDASGKTFRDDLYDQYKATRTAMPDDLRVQIEPIHQVIRMLGWPVLSIPGVEADDVIGTLAVQATARGIQSIVSTGDKDLAQLVNEHVTLVNTMSQETLTPAAVQEKFGVAPNKIVDYLMLMGDTVDNVPGVEKVGPKTAAKWIAEHGSIEGVIQVAPTMKGVAGENLRKALGHFELTRKLLTVATDVDLAAHVADFEQGLKATEQDIEGLKQFYDQYGFRSWLRELSGDSQAIPSGDNRVKEQAKAPTAPAQVQYDCVQTWEQFDQWMQRIEQAPLVALDTETTSLSEMQARIVGLSFATEPGLACYIPLAHRLPDAPTQLPLDEALAKLKPWLEDATKPKLLQHAKYDAHVFANHGISLRGIAHDTMLQGYVLESHKSTGMQALAQRWLGLTGISYEDVAGKGASQIGFDEVSLEQATAYSAEDSDFTLRLHQALYPQIEPDAQLKRIYELEMPTSRVLTTIERNGVLIDAQKLAQQSHELGSRMLEIEQQSYELAGQPFNLNSPKQLAEILFTKLKLPIVKKTASGTPSTDEEVLSKLAEDYPLPKLLMDYRGLSKLKSTYTDKLPKMIHPQTGRVHTSYAQAAVVTGRLASSEPNLQNIPVRTAEGRRIREAFIAPAGHRILSADYSQIELRIMAHISQDKALLEAFAQGQDVHRATASEVFSTPPDQVTSEQRRYAKVINFGLIYGMGVFGLASNLGIERDAAKLYMDKYFARYTGVAQYMENTRIQARSQGYVTTVFGRRLWLSEINSPNGPRRQGAERAAINAPMQGTAADLIKMAMIAVQEWIEREQLQTKLIMQVHDELVLQAPEAEVELVKQQVPLLMANVAQLDVPLLAEIGAGHNWEEAH